MSMKLQTTFHTILLGVGLFRLDQFKTQGVDLQRSAELARKLYAYSVQYTCKLTATRRAIESKSTHYDSGALGPCAARNPPDPHWLLSYPLARKLITTRRAIESNNTSRSQVLETSASRNALDPH
eukprot:1161637-Pelagomonas_calceolata.AAC.4